MLFQIGTLRLRSLPTQVSTTMVWWGVRTTKVWMLSRHLKSSVEKCGRSQSRYGSKRSFAIPA